MTSFRSFSRRGLILGGGLVALGLTGCSSGAGADGSTQPTGGGPRPFHWTDGRGRDIDLEETPRVVVAQSSAAAALWDAGLHVAGAYGELTEQNGELGYQAGDLDLAELTVVGKSFGEFDLEKLASLGPELLVDMVFTPGSLWYVPEDSLEKVEALTPTLGMEMLNLHLVEIIENFVRLATELGADTDAAGVPDSRAAFEKSVAKVEKAIAAKPDLKVVGYSYAEGGGVYIANPTQHPDFAYLADLGVTFVQPESAKKEEYFTEVSLEELDRWEADLVFVDARDTTASLEKQPTYRKLKAVQAGQVAPWYPASPYSYKANVEIMAGFAEALTGAARLV